MNIPILRVPYQHRRQDDGEQSVPWLNPKRTSTTVRGGDILPDRMHYNIILLPAHIYIYITCDVYYVQKNIHISYIYSVCVFRGAAC